MQLSLEGNNLTNFLVKIFYSVPKKKNKTLRLLDLTDNSGIDENVDMMLDWSWTPRQMNAIYDIA